MKNVQDDASDTFFHTRSTPEPYKWILDTHQYDSFLHVYTQVSHHAVYVTVLYGWELLYMRIVCGIYNLNKFLLHKDQSKLRQNRLVQTGTIHRIYVSEKLTLVRIQFSISFTKHSIVCRNLLHPERQRR